MKVLHIYKVYRPDIDGGIPFVISTLGKLTGDNLENKVLVARRRGRGGNYCIDGVAVEAVSSLGTVFSTPLSPAFPAAILRATKSCDLVVYHAPFPIADSILPWLPKHIGLIVYWHADIARYSFLKTMFKPFISATLRRADRIIVSDAFNISSSKTLSAFAGKCVVVPFGIDVATWSNCTPAETSRAASLRQTYPRMILAVGRLVPYKGLSVLVRAMAQVDGQLVIIGEGSLRQKLADEARALGISHKVVFAGRLSTSEIKAYLHAARLLAFPSVSAAETFGIAQLEAMAAALPIVNTALSTAVPRVARDHIEALTVAPDDPDALRKAISTLLDDQSLADRLGTAGRERVRTEYEEKIYLTRMRAVYDGVIDRLPSAT